MLMLQWDCRVLHLTTLAWASSGAANWQRKMQSPNKYFCSGLKGHNQLGYMRIRYHFLANLHITEMWSIWGRGGYSLIWAIWGWDVQLDRVWFFGLTVLNRVCYYELRDFNPDCSNSKQSLSLKFLACYPGPARSWKSMQSSGGKATHFFSWLA